ncbi:MAG TPA: double-strand break repair helicase AddA, partial [Stellaceae bacterium]|nr:double-strand break repair helicase AddA [Stellaceae bacterium]
LNEELAKWATLRSGALAETLQKLTGHMPSDTTIARARQLFARVLETPGGIRIATIHAFCQTLLRRFPMEAGVTTEFAVIDERSARETLIEAGERVILAARNGREPQLADALSVVARHAPEERFGALMGSLVAERGKLRQVLAEGPAELRNKLCGALDLPSGTTEEAVVAAFCAAGAGDEVGLRSAAAALCAGSCSDRERGAILDAWCETPGQRRQMLPAYLPAFLKVEGEIRKILITQDAARRAGCDAEAVLRAEGERVKKFCEAQAAAALVEASCALIRLGGALMDAYAELKRAHGVLDYDDLISAALDLLRRPGIAPWVLFKLDGGLDHILIDEAQDTNPEQWQIVAALAEEFFAGEGAGDHRRTIFAVGDAKQSIYSFQRADPRAFLAMRDYFERRVSDARQGWRVVPLEVSFRSTEPVLRAIDAVFRHEAARDGVALDGNEIRHIASRAGHAGVVELWPPAVALPEEPTDPIALPVIRQRTTEPRTRLANAIAATIAAWVRNGEMLEACGRPLRPGDVMVLVRRRNEFVSELLRALKQRNIPVAGADRLILTEQLAVQDLVALGRFLLLPEDDLTLATVLKGPLFGFGEETLFDLAYDRGGEKLWQQLRAKADKSPQLRRAVETLTGLLARADFVPPYELYAEILGAQGGRRMLLERLGIEAEDPVEEFLALALSYEREHVPSLQGFLRWLVAGDTEVKRDFGASRGDEVRILTVHGAKGLEAPVVFLPDTMQLPKLPDTLLWTEREGLPLWCPRRDLAVPFYTTEKRALRARHLQEYRRLLYVALSRAQDRLYICGWQTQEPPKVDSWHALCRTGLTEIAVPFSFDTTALIGADGWCGQGLRLTSAQGVPPVRERPIAVMGAAPQPLPNWVHQPAPTEPDPPRPLAPSRPSGAEPPTISPLAAQGRDRFKRGLLVHRLLQSLPELPIVEREVAARRFLALATHRLTAEEQDEIRRETLAVLDHPDLAALFGPGSQAEVPLVGLIGGHALSGQIDRLVVSEDRVLIVDYKSLRPPPVAEDEVAPIYLRQLAAYQAALARIYPDREIRCALLWTEGPRLMPISPEILAGYLP